MARQRLVVTLECAGLDHPSFPSKPGVPFEQLRFLLGTEQRVAATTTTGPTAEKGLAVAQITRVQHTYGVNAQSCHHRDALRRRCVQSSHQNRLDAPLIGDTAGLT